MKLPGERDSGLIGIGPQAAESKQIDVLNIFNDGSQEDGTGVMTSTSLSGFGMAKELNFGLATSTNGQTFGEPAIFPAGITFGTVAFVDGKFQTNGAKTSIEVVNVLLAGQRQADDLGTIDPDIAVS